MHYTEMDIIEELITAKIKGSVIRKNMFLRLLSNINFDYQTKDYELVINRLIKDGELKEKLLLFRLLLYLPIVGQMFRHNYGVTPG